MGRDSENNGSGRNSISEMEQIQKGLEEFLQQELQSMESGGQKKQQEPQFFNIREEEQQEKEIDIIASDYYEDWDSAERRKSSKTKRSSAAKRSGTASKKETAPGSGKRASAPASAGSTKRGKQTEASGSNRKDSAKRKKEQDMPVSRKAKIKEQKPKKKKSGFKRFLVTAAVILALLAAGLYYVVGVVYDKMKFEQVDSLAKAPVTEDGVTNILLIGNDSRENGEDGRSDAMILLSISNKTKKIYMTSLLRDMYVDIPGHDGNRLNAAYSFGGAELLMETIEQNFDLSVNRYVLVNFEAFANLVDAVGGIELELTSEEIEYVNGYLVEYNMLTDRPQGTDNMDTSVSGLVHLNGPQALAYSRNRYLGTDFGRTERQRKVLTAVIQKLPRALLTNPKGLIDGLMPNLTTNLTQAECFGLSLTAPKLLTYDIVQTSIPAEGTYKNATIRKMAVLEVDFEANKKYIRENIYGETGN